MPKTIDSYRDSQGRLIRYLDPDKSRDFDVLFQERMNRLCQSSEPCPTCGTRHDLPVEELTAEEAFWRSRCLSGKLG